MTKAEKRQLAELMAKARNEYLDALYSGKNARDIERLFITSEALNRVGEVIGCDHEYYRQLTSVDRLFV